MERGASKHAARLAIASAASDILDVSHRIHACPELAFEEVEASALLTGRLADAGFAVRPRLAGLDTAFDARIGTGDLHLAILAEYDALPGIGHACGHNVVAAAAFGAARGLAALVADLGVTVHIIGTPAEEAGNGGGKILLLERGAFDGIHAALMVHPSGTENTLASPFFAVSVFDARFVGRESHAGMHPELGVNAADALTIAQTAIGLLRQQLLPTVRVSGVVTNGGAAAQVIPGETRARYIVRARTLDDLEEAKARVVRCFDAGALATGCTLEITGGDKPYADVRHDGTLAGAFAGNWRALGHTFAPDDALAGASTDLGNVSRVLPVIHPMLAIGAPEGVVNHQPAFADACTTPTADQVVLDAATALAWTCIDAALDPTIRTYLLEAKGF